MVHHARETCHVASTCGVDLIRSTNQATATDCSTRLVFEEGTSLLADCPSTTEAKCCDTGSEKGQRRRFWNRNKSQLILRAGAVLIEQIQDAHVAEARPKAAVDGMVRGNHERVLALITDAVFISNHQMAFCSKFADVALPNPLSP